MLDAFITIVSSIIEIWSCKKVFDYTSQSKTDLKTKYVFSLFCFSYYFFFIYKYRS